MTEETFQFTPGPWAVRPKPYDDWGWVRDSRGLTVAMARNPDAGDLDDYRASRTDPYGANARLIAAAPDLLEALMGLVDAIDYRETPEGKRSYAILGTMPPAFHAARAIISRALTPSGDA